jgi:hypothetical protein
MKNTKIKAKYLIKTKLFFHSYVSYGSEDNATLPDLDYARDFLPPFDPDTFLFFISFPTTYGFYYYCCLLASSPYGSYS